jgi:Tol biopolymer transport system component
MYLNNLPINTARRTLAALVLLAGMSLSCESSTDPGDDPEPVSLQLSTVSSSQASIVANGTSTAQITVALKNETGEPITTSRGVVTLSTTRGTIGAVSDQNNGSYTATLTSSTTAGTATLSASLDGSPLASTTTVTFVAGPAAVIAVGNAASNGQSAVAGGTVAIPPSVKITDASGNAVPNIAVTFAVTSGGGSITGASQTTNDSGIATVGSWTLGNSAGPNTVSATAAGIAGTVTFTATGTAGSAGAITIVAGNAQTAVAGSDVTTAPSVKVTDANGNTVAGATVTFSVASGGGSVTGATATSNASGIATVGSWKLGTAAGTNTLTASSGTLPAVTFTATGIAGAAALISINSGNNQTVTAGGSVGVPPSVKVTDANANAVAGAAVTFAVVSGGGSITGATPTTNASGIAQVGSWTLGPTPGVNTLSATLTAVPSAVVTFSATGSAGSPINITVTGRLERSQTVSLSLTQNGSPVSVGSVTLALAPSDGGQINADGTVKLLKTGSLAITASTSNASGAATISVAQPPIVVFDLLRDGFRHIWQVALDGGDLLQLTHAGSDNQHGSRVGDKLVYASARNGMNFDIFSMTVSTGSETNITNTTYADRDPSLSPDGQRIAFISTQTGADRARYMNVDGTNGGAVADNTANVGAIETTPSWSPTSDKIIFSSNATGNLDLWITTSLGGVATKLPAPANGAETEIGAVWNAAGQIAFHTTRSGPDENEIWITNQSGSSATNLTDGVSPSWTADGRIVFVRFTGTTGALYWIDPADPAVVHPISVGGGNAQRPSTIRP